MTELLTDPGHSRSEMRMVKQAIVHKWDIPEALFEVLPKVVGTIAVKGKGREQSTAVALLLKMKEQNDRIDQPKQAAQTNVNVGVKVDNRTDDERTATLAIAKRIRESRFLRDAGSG